MDRWKTEPSNMTQYTDDFYKFLCKHNYIDTMYRAMAQDDISKVIVAALEILLKTGTMPTIQRKTKNETESILFRDLGNQAYASSKHQVALELYNKAILYAPQNSTAMKLAYSNRSALLLKVKAYSACLKDIETCLSMGCTPDIIKKLQKRKAECFQFIQLENLKNDMLRSEFAKEFFKFNMKRHSQIPCASIDVDVVLKEQLPKVIAARDIKVGTVVSVETPFISELNYENLSSSCYYCHKRYFNLMPCDGCTIALFCDEKCKKLCINEYHRVECQVIHVLMFFPGSTSKLSFKAAIKMKQQCTWKELIAESYSIGVDRMLKSTINEIYDVNRKFSILNFDESNIKLMQGSLFNFSFNCATMIYYLGNVPNYLPPKEEKHDAICALGRLMASLFLLFPNRLTIVHSVEMLSRGEITTDTECNTVWSSFANKLSHECDANLLALELNNKVALIALKPIKKGSELTISYIGQYYEHMHVSPDMSKHHRAWKLYCITQSTCNCCVCKEKWTSFNYRKLKITKEQMKCYRNWDAARSRYIVRRDDETVFKQTCEALGVFQDFGNTKEHHELFGMLRRFLSLFQYVETGNVIIDNLQDK